MSKILKSATPVGEVVHCMCGTEYEVEAGDGWKVIDTHPQIQEDGSRVDLPTRIEFHVPCPHCEFEKTFIVVVDSLEGSEWAITRKARADHAALEAKQGVPPHEGPDVVITNSAAPAAVADAEKPIVSEWHPEVAPAVDPNPVLPFAPTGAIPGRDSQPQDTTLPVNQAQPLDNPHPSLLLMLEDRALLAKKDEAAKADAEKDGAAEAKAGAKKTDAGKRRSILDKKSDVKTPDVKAPVVEGGKSVEAEFVAAATGDPEKSAKDVEPVIDAAREKSDSKTKTS